MKKIDRTDVKDLVAYEKERETARQRLIALKRHRRVPVGDLLSFLFENHATVLFQIQEMIRTERMVEEEKIREEIEVYNELIPSDRELSATMFIEVGEPGQVRAVLDRLQGIDRGDGVYLQVGELKVAGLFEGGRSTEEKLSAVHYVKFPFSEATRDAFCDSRVAALLVVDHPRYQGRTAIAGEVRRSLIDDLTGRAIAPFSP